MVMKKMCCNYLNLVFLKKIKNKIEINLNKKVSKNY